MADKTLFQRDYVFYGDYARKVNDLTDIIDKDSGAKIFDFTIELFITAAIVGCHYGKRSKPQKSGDKKSSIMAGQFSTHSDELKFAFKLVLLTADRNNVDAVDRLNRTFKNPNTDENYTLFEEYMLGGIDILHDTFKVDSNHSYLDYLDSLRDLISEFNQVGDSTTEIPTTAFFD